MALYVDGFLLPVPKRKLNAYLRIAKQASKIWRDHGALEYRECVGDDLAIPGVASFQKRAAAKKGETVVFSWIVYKSRAQRDAANGKVMKDPRMLKMVEKMKKEMPFDMKRMAYGGFKVGVDA
jgi:uncharacterized protein YbaA (DUF1428 family)